jgi:hypothetical protein
MKRLAVILLTGTLAAGSFAEKPKFEPFGFVKGDMYCRAFRPGNVVQRNRA